MTLPEQLEGKWNGVSALAKQACNGNGDALHFVNLWFLYCHRIDDILDSRLDGRPTLSTEEILETFVCAAVLYSSPFFVTHRNELLSVVLLVTNQFADSVKWERDPAEHKRIMADVMQCCGNEMFFAVAMICGGWDHVRKLSPLIRERDWKLQHDDNSQP